MNQPPLTNPSPKARFQESADNVSKHRSLVDSREFQRAMDYGLLQYQVETALQCKDQMSAMAAGLKMQGVLEFMQVVRNLSEQPRATRPVPADNLTETH